MHSQVVCVPPGVSSHGPQSFEFLLKPAPSARTLRKNRTNRSPALQPSSPPRSLTRRRSRSSASSISKYSLSPIASFLNLSDTPSIFRKSPSSRSAAPSPPSLLTPSPVLNPKRHARRFEEVPFTYTPSPSVDSILADEDEVKERPSHESEATLVGETKTRSDQEAPAFLLVDPYGAKSPDCAPPTFTYAYGPRQDPLPISKYPSHSFLNHTPPTSPSTRPRKRSNTTTTTVSVVTTASLTSTKSLQALKRTLSFSKLFKTMSSSSRPSSTAISASSSKRRAPEKILPFTTQQIAELDRLMGNPKAAKGKAPSELTSGVHAPQHDKRYIVPYVPLNGSAPSGTRSFGRDGEFHPIVSPTGTGSRQVGTGAALPYMRDENGVLWSGQEEMDEYQQLLTPEEAEAQRRRRASLEQDWKNFTPHSASSLESSRSILRSSGSSDVFDLGYDDAVMIPEGGAVGLAPVSTIGGWATSGAMISTRGVESFPSPTGDRLISSSRRSRAAGPVDRKRTPPSLEPVNAGSVTSLGTITPTPLPLDKEGRLEFFNNAFAPPPATPSPTSAKHSETDRVAPLPEKAARSKAHRHSTSLAVGSAKLFANLVGQATNEPLSPTTPTYLAPLASPGGYTGIRQSSFSGPCNPPVYASSPVRGAPIAEKQLKKKSSGLGVAQMFRKFTAKA